MAFLIAYYLDVELEYLLASINITEVIFVIDVAITLLHTFWPLVRLHMRVYRRGMTYLVYDVLSLVPCAVVGKNILSVEIS